MPTLLLASLLSAAKARLREAGVESFALDADLLMAHAIGKDRAFIIGHPEYALTAGEASCFHALTERREKREPMAHLLGRREFWGREFVVTKDTLDPRPDSETLIAAVFSQFPDHTRACRILDLGTGTGCLLLTLLAEYPHAYGVAVEKSEAALAVAEENAARLGLTSRVRFHGGGWEDFTPDMPFDIIVSNPPYIPLAEKTTLAPEVAGYEPHSALFAGEDGLSCYRALLPLSRLWLVPGGALFLEHGKGQEESIARLAEAEGWKVTAYYPDLAGISRCMGLAL